MIYASASGLVGQFAVCTAAIGIVDERFFAVVATGQVGKELSQCAEKRVFLFCAKLLPKLGARTFRLRNTRSDRTF